MLESVLNICFFLILVFAAVMGAAFFWQWFYSRPTQQDETIFFNTSDGMRLALHRYRPEGPVDGLPVLLCHGLSSNRYMFELPQAPSLAGYLKSQGRDVWVVELRGSGMSDRPGLRTADVPYSWHFEDHLFYDVPAVIECVLKRTAAPALHWVGHSMGGLLILAHLARSQQPPIASAVTMGSPADFSQIRSNLFSFLRRLRRLLGLTPFLPLTFFNKAASPIAHMMPNLLHTLFHAPNIRSDVAVRAVALASQVVTSSSLWMDFGRFLNQGALASPDGRSYLDGLEKSQVPLFTTGGTKDVMAPPAAVKAAYFEGKDPELQSLCIFGKESGCVEDYGHVDLLVGERVETEVFPKILEWLKKHETKSTT